MGLNDFAFLCTRFFFATRYDRNKTMLCVKSLRREERSAGSLLLATRKLLAFFLSDLLLSPAMPVQRHFHSSGVILLVRNILVPCVLEAYMAFPFPPACVYL